MKILVLGGEGQVARAVALRAPEHHSVVLRSRRNLDITDESAVTAELANNGVQWVINGAAYTAVDRAESEPAAAIAVNDLAVGALARAASRCGCRVLHLSTDFVFDGRSNRAYLPPDETGPLGVYGSSKLAGEQQLLQHASDSICLRTAWVYASSGKNFALTMLRLMHEKPEVRVVADQVGTPTWASSIADVIWRLIDASADGGIYHWTDLGLASWYDFAVAIQDEALALGLLTRAIPVVPISTLEYPTPAQRPAFSVLDTASTRAVAPCLAVHWRHNLRKMLYELRAA